MQSPPVFSSRSTQIAARLAAFSITLTIAGAIDALASHYQANPQLPRVAHERSAAVGECELTAPSCAENNEVSSAEFPKPTGDH